MTVESETDLKDVRKSATWSSGLQRVPGGPSKGHTLCGDELPGGQRDRAWDRRVEPEGDSIITRWAGLPGPGQDRFLH